MPIRRRSTPVPEPALGVAAVARRLGVAAGTLRTWDRRYGLGPSGHEPGARRRYTALDLARLELMRRLMLQGVAAAEAAAAAVAARPGDLAVPADAAGERAGAPAPSWSAGRRSGPRPPRPAGGGRVVAVREAGPAARGLARAAMALDSDACAALLRAALVRSGVVPTWTEVLVPVLIGVGDRWQSTGAGVEVEHLLSETAESVLRSVPAPRAAVNSRPVLLAALEPEEHRLPLVALGAALAERKVGTRLLGVRLPARALGQAVTRTGALAVFLWDQGAGGERSARLPDGVEALGQALRPRPVLLLGGPGWDPDREGPRAAWLPDLATAVEATVSLAGGAVAGVGSR